MANERHFSEKDPKTREIVSFLYETLFSHYSSGALRFITEDTKGGKSVLQLIEKDNLKDAQDKIDQIYKAYNIDEKTFSKDQLIDTIKTVIDLYKENPANSLDSLESTVLPKEEVEDPIENTETEQPVFNEKEMEEIVNNLYEKISKPELNQHTLSQDFISYARASLALDLETNDQSKIGINDLIDAYNEVLKDQNNLDLRKTLVWLLPQIEEELKLRRLVLNEEILKIRKDDSLSGNFDDLMDSIAQCDELENNIVSFKETLDPILVEDEKDTIYTTTVYVTSSLPASIDSKTSIVTKEDTKEDTLEKTPQEKFEDLIFKKGINKIVIHGGMIESKKPENGWLLTPRVDFDADSAIMILDELGVKYNKGATSTWVHPEAKLKEDKKGNHYFEYKDEKIYLEDGTVVFDVGKSNGLKMLKDTVFVLDHHGDGSNEITSTTKILVESVEGFKKYQDKKENFPEYLKNYAELVTLVDNLSMDTDMGREEFEKKYALTMPALVPLLYYKNPKMLLDIFKKYPDISINGFSKKELKYPVGVREYTSVDDNRNGFSGINIYSEIPKNYNPKYVYEEFTIGDLVQNQQKVVENSIKEIDYHIQKMFKDGLKTNSPITGKTVFINQESFKYIDYKGAVKKYNTYIGNSFGASTVYNMGYDTMIILNKDKGNQIFVSSKNHQGLKKFADNFKIYYDNAVTVRDSMFILRDINLKNENSEYLRNAIVDSAKIDGFDIGDFNKTIDDLIKEIKENKE